MKVLIIGYGSVGKRHFQVLKSIDCVKQIDLVTRQNPPGVTSFRSLSCVDDLNIYDYFIIASETVKHYEQLKYLNSKVSNKMVLIEKPLFDKRYEKIDGNNQLFIGYNLRFHPILGELRRLLMHKKVYYANIYCGQYLPLWREGRDYRDTYSASKSLGGGVLRDLSHELDYTVWLFGALESKEFIKAKVSDLEIDTEDIFTLIATSEKRTIISLSIDYISKTLVRRLLIHTENSTIEADIANNRIDITSKDGTIKVINTENTDSNYTYRKMHQAILDGDFSTVCSIWEGYDMIDLIEGMGC